MINVTNVRKCLSNSNEMGFIMKTFFYFFRDIFPQYTLFSVKYHNIILGKAIAIIGIWKSGVSLRFTSFPLFLWRKEGRKFWRISFSLVRYVIALWIIVACDSELHSIKLTLTFFSTRRGGCLTSVVDCVAVFLLALVVEAILLMCLAYTVAIQKIHMSLLFAPQWTSGSQCIL